MRKNTIYINFPDILIFLFSLFYMITHTIRIPVQLGNFAIASTGLMCLIFVFLKKGFDNFNNRILLIGICFSFFMILSILYNKNASWDNILWIWAYLGIALLIFRYNISLRMLYIVFCMISIYFFKNAFNGVSPQSVLNDASGNNISIILIFFVILIYLQIDRQNKKVIYFPAIITVVLSFWGNGRAGLIASSVFLLLIFLYQYIYIMRGNLIPIIKFLTLIIIICFLIHNFFGDAIDDFIYKYDRYGMTSIRTTIWQEYLNGSVTNLGNFLFGVPTRSNIYHYMSYYNGNTHNSFLMLHAKFGIIAFFYVNKIFIQSLYISIKEKKYIIFISVITIIIRSMFDWAAFPGIFDVIFWYLVMYVNKTHFTTHVK